ncbi:FAD binding domain-containing protein, partial [Penicillium malachiteum]|uniref:FAD binding domain-containing protein n=1 Tax=Penicillium malachiteum TaxID=1324776 RepID=UPI002548C238
MASEERPFRVIVVGGGVSGLAASHAFQKAGIEHVVLERRNTVAPAEGASIAVYPHGARILHQLGCLSTIKQHSSTPDRWRARLPSGKLIANNGVFRVIEANHGSGLLLIERRQFLQDLYDTLPDKTPIKTSSVIEDIRQDEDGIEVRLSDGSFERGDLVVGCDGVHSFVRRTSWEHANKTSLGSITVKEKLAIRADWKCLVVTTNPVPELGDRDLTIVHNKNYSHMYTVTPTLCYFFVFFHLDEPWTFPKRTQYTSQDAQDIADKIANHAMSNTVVFGEVWKRRIRAA